MLPPTTSWKTTIDFVWGDIDNAIHRTTPTHLPDTALQPPFQASNQCLDNGAAVEWDGVGSGTTIRQNFAFGTTSSSPAYVQGFSAKRHGSAVTFRWRTVLPRILAGFYLYAGSHRLDRRIVPVHARPDLRPASPLAGTRQIQSARRPTERLSGRGECRVSPSRIASRR